MISRRHLSAAVIVAALSFELQALPVALSSMAEVRGNFKPPTSPESYTRVEQAGTLNPLYAEINAGRPEREKYASGAVDAMWADEAHGTVAFKNFGWTAATNGNFEAYAQGAFRYEFMADADGSLVIDFETHFQASPTPPSGFNVLFMGSENYIDYVNPSAAGSYSYDLFAGETYSVAIMTNNSSSKMQGPAEMHLDGLFEWRIDALAPPPPPEPPKGVPEPATLALVLLGLGAMGFGRGRRR